MDLAGFLAQSPPIPAHALVAIAALALGLWQLAAAKGGPAHRHRGRLWAAGMGFVAASGLFIHEGHNFGLFGPIQLLSLTTLIGLPIALHAARTGKLARHRWMMRTMVLAGLGLAGALALLPGRSLHSALFGG